MIAASVSIGTLFAYCQLYLAPAGSSNYAPITGTKIHLTPGIAVASIGTVSSGSASGLNIPVSAGDQLLMVFSAQNSSVLSIVGSINGYAAGGVAIA
jgi:BclB C-terminal domain-containing protein